jgi:hypothetical protein
MKQLASLSPTQLPHREPHLSFPVVSSDHASHGRTGEAERLRARSRKTQRNEILCCGPYEAYPPGRNKFIHSIECRGWVDCVHGHSADI